MLYVVCRRLLVVVDCWLLFWLPLCWLQCVVWSFVVVVWLLVLFVWCCLLFVVVCCSLLYAVARCCLLYVVVCCVLLVGAFCFMLSLFVAVVC